MPRKIVFLLFWWVASGSVASAYGQTAPDLHRQCVQTQKALIGEAEGANLTEAAMCASWAAGYLYGLNASRLIAKDFGKPDPLADTCVPPVFKISAGRLVSIIVQHGLESPKDLEQDIESFAVRALLGAFPCRE